MRIPIWNLFFGWPCREQKKELDPPNWQEMEMNDKLPIFKENFIHNLEVYADFPRVYCCLL